MPTGIYKHPPQCGFQKGFTPWTKGTKGIVKPNSGSFKKGQHPSVTTEFKKGHKGWNKGKKRPERSMENHPCWKGGITSLMERIRKSFKYRQWRSDIFTRDNFICQDCGKRGGALEAHHIKNYWKIIRDNQINNFEKAMNCSELWNINNGITFCEKCHSKTKCGRMSVVKKILATKLRVFQLGKGKF